MYANSSAPLNTFCRQTLCAHVAANAALRNLNPSIGTIPQMAFSKSLQKPRLHSRGFASLIIQVGQNAFLSRRWSVAPHPLLFSDSESTFDPDTRLLANPQHPQTAWMPRLHDPHRSKGFFQFLRAHRVRPQFLQYISKHTLDSSLDLFPISHRKG